MAFMEVSVVQIREVLRRWLRGDEGLRTIAEGAGVDRKTVRRYVEAGQAAGLTRDGGEEQLTEELLGLVLATVRPGRPAGHGQAFEQLVVEHERIQAWVDKGLSVAKIGDLLGRRGVTVPERTLQRYCAQCCGTSKAKDTVRVTDGAPGVELQADFGRMGMLFDPDTGRRRVVHALVLVAVYSRHMFVWLSFTQTTEDVIEGLEAAWAFFGGVFGVLIPDNLSPVVSVAEPTEPRFNDTFLEYSQSRGFLIDAARVRKPQDKPRVERQVPYVRNRFFAGEDFVDLADAQRRAEQWCATSVGRRIHGTTRLRPAEVFAVEEQALLLPAPSAPYDVPVFSTPKVHRDHHVEVARALYSVPGSLIGTILSARADATSVKLYAKGQLVKVHPRMAPGKRSTDPEDLPAERSAYAMRDLDALLRLARSHGAETERFAAAVLDHPLPWTKMRQVYRLLGLVKRWGPERGPTGLCEG